MTLSIDTAELDIPCPRCRFFNEVTIKQARTRDVVICRGCKGNIRLDDHMNQVRTAERQLCESISALDYKACARDVQRFCRPLMDQGDFVILACLQQNRAKLTAPCRQVLTNHGQ